VNETRRNIFGIEWNQRVGGNVFSRHAKVA
jgi:hypothetical protein